MRYIKRPAWRSQLGLIILATGLLLITLLPLIDAAAAHSVKASTSKVSAVAVLSFMTALPLFAVLAIILYRHYSRRYIVRNGDIESRKGIIARTVNAMKLMDLLNITVNQSVLDRLLIIGDVEFSSAASSGVEVIFHNVSRPMKIKEDIQKMMF